MITWIDVEVEYKNEIRNISVESDANIYTIRIRRYFDKKKTIREEHSFTVGQEDELIDFIFKKITRITSMNNFEIITDDNNLAIYNAGEWYIEAIGNTKNIEYELQFIYATKKSMIRKLKKIIKGNIKIEVV